MKRKNINRKEFKVSYFSKAAWIFYLQFLKEDKLKLISTSLGFVAISYLILPTLWLIKYVLDVSIPEKQTGNFIVICFGVLFIRLFNSTVSLFLRNTNIKTVSKSIFKLREYLMNKIFLFSRSFYTREDLGVLHVQIVEDTERISRMSYSLIAALLPAIILSLGLCCVLAYLNYKLFLIILLFSPILYYSNKYLGKILKQKVYDFRRSFEGFSSRTLFLIRFIDLIKIQSVENEEREKHTDILYDLQTKTTSKTFFNSLYSQIQNNLIGLIGITVIIFGGIAVINNQMTIGELMTFYLAANQLQDKLNNLNDSFTNLLTGNDSLIILHSIATLYDHEPYTGKTKLNFKGKLVINSVSFQYSEKPVLTNVNLTINHGDRIAIIGENGAGKSTIINLILGFFKPISGSISAENIDFNEIDFQNFRKQIGVVTQHPPLIAGTIRENLLYGNSECTEFELLQASKLSLTHNFVKNFPEEYDTQVGDNGILLSGGERQKLAIARALLRKPNLLIFDEPTNHLDSQAVKEIMNNIKTINYNPSIVIISHDMTVVNHADTIYLLKNGQLTSFKN